MLCGPNWLSLKVPALDLLAKHLGLYQRPAAPVAAVGFKIVIHGLDDDEPGTRTAGT